MRVVRLHAAGDLRPHEEPEPVPGPGEELVRVTAVGLCGSDRHWFVDGGIGDATLSRPLVLGHEIAGIVESGPRHGLRVAIDPADPCGQCDVCMAGRSNLCASLRFAGHGSTDGGLRSRMAWPRRLLHPLPDAIPDAEGALLEPLAIAIHAVDLGEVRPGMSAGVYGCGPIGLLLVQLLRLIGCAPIIATDRLAHRVAAARTMGATDALRVDPDPKDPDAARPASSVAESSVDVAFEVAGEDDAVADAVRSVRPGCRVILVGIPADDRTSFRASVARRKGIQLLLCRRMTARELPRAIRLVEAGGLELASLISERHGIEAVGSAFASLVDRRGLKIIVEPAPADA